MTDPNNVPIPLTELPTWLESEGLKRRSPETCLRWATRGHHGVRLHVDRRGGQKTTTVARVREFLQRTGLA